MAVDELLYDPSAIEGATQCSPLCMNGGICQNRICFCLVPFGDDHCQTDLEVATRINILLFICMLIGGLIIGFLLVFIFKFIYDCIFIKEQKPVKEDADTWEP